MKKETTKKNENKQILEEVAEKVTQKMEEDIERIEREKTVEAIAEGFKKDHKEVFITDMAGIQIVWRKLKRSEYKELMTAEFSEHEELQFLERQEFIAKKVILYPYDVEELIEEYAGIAEIIATETMLKTGFGLTNTRTV